jgi:PTH1 family peptidyl-tRNA hydrolase
VGLGNPGPRYLETRHNVGFRTVELAARRLGVALRRPWFRNYRLARAEGLRLVQPLTYMNRSGNIFAGLWPGPRPGVRLPAPVTELLVVCDTLDLPPGQCRLRRGGASAGHKGLASIIAALGRADFLRLYIGIGRPSRQAEVVEYVLGSPGGPEAEALRRGVERAAEGVLALLREDPEKVMNVLNQAPARS